MKFKKIILSSFLVLAITAYALYERLGGGAAPAVSLNPELSSNIPTSTEPQTQVVYKDGEYNGTSENTIYGKVQVAAVISGGKITDVKFLQFPNDRDNSINISNASLPRLKTEAIAAQSAKIDIVSGATQTSEGFRDSLAAALVLAQS